MSKKWLVCCLVGLALPAACSEEAAPDPGPPPVDPRYASAEALVATFNSLVTNAPVDVRSVGALYYAETPTQEQLIRIIDLMNPVIDAARRLEQQFGQSLGDVGGAIIETVEEPAVISEHSGQRAKARFVDALGRPAELYLVKIGDRWWLSGYTLEYLPELREELEHLDLIEAGMRALADVFPRVIDRVLSGEITMGPELVQALEEAGEDYERRHPLEIEKLRRLDQLDPGIFGP